MSEEAYFAHPSAIIDDGATIGRGTKIWHFVHVASGAQIGADCVLGQNVFVSGTAVIGHRCKIQNNVSIYDAVTLSDDVFIGPSVTFTNVLTPRAFISQKGSFKKTIVGKGATIGANSTIVCGNNIGDYCFVGAASVVTKSLKPFGLYYGNPAMHIGWVNHRGSRLSLPLSGEKTLKCPDSQLWFVLKGETLSVASE